MVGDNKVHKLQEQEDIIDYTFLPEPLKHTSVSLKDIFANKLRLEASSFSIDAKIAKEKIINCKYGYKNISGKNGYCKSYRPGIIKRHYVNKKDGVPMFTPAQITEIYPKPYKFLSKEQVKQLDDWFMVEGELALTCSGTVGNVSMVSKTLKGKLFSQNMIRLYDYEFLGYIYAFLQSESGKKIITSNNYGAVIKHIDPEHLESVIIPNAPEKIQKNIHELIINSFQLRDKSNELIDEAESILYKELELKPIDELNSNFFDNSKELRNYTIKLSELKYRLDSSFHLPHKRIAKKLLKLNAKEMIEIGNSKISKQVYTGNRFKRVYVSKENGKPYLTGKHLMELNPGGYEKKYLSIEQHGNQIKNQLSVKPNTIIVTCSGSIGKTVLVPKHWEGWVGTHDLIRIIPESDSIAGYLYCFLNSSYGKILLHSFVYGAVVDHIEAFHVSSILLPILKNEEQQKKINDLILKANELRYKAHQKEQEAIKKMEDIINETK